MPATPLARLLYNTLQFLSTTTRNYLMSHRPCHFSPVISYAGIDKRYTRKYNKQVSHPPPFGPVAQLGAHHIRIVGVVGSNPIRSTRKSREIISFTAFLQLFCKNGGPAAQPFLPYFPYKPPLRSHPLFRTPETIIIFVLRPSGKAEKIWK